MAPPLITVELTWLDGQNCASIWRCTPDGNRLRWEGFKRLDDAVLRSPAVQSVTTIIGGDLRRALVTLLAPITGADGAATATARTSQGAS